MKPYLGRTALALVLIVASATAATCSTAASAAAATCSSDSTLATNAQSASRRPVIFVHGWTSNGTALQDTGEKLFEQTDHRIQPFYFDYRSQATTWAANEAVAGCLSDYIEKVSAAYWKARGDGKVILVGHSMGGLASLYAATGNARAAVGGLITFDTPYLGSPFGDTGIAGWWQGVKQTSGALVVPPVGSDAQLCLGEHVNGARLHDGCGYELPPYLPASVPVTAIAGDVVVKRMFGPIHLYDIDLGSDGIVSQDSSHGYLQIQKKSAWPKGAVVSLKTDKCWLENHALEAGARAAGWSTGAIGALLVAAAQLYVDSNALDGLLSGTLTPALAVYLGASLIAQCSHVRVYEDQSALNMATEALKDYLKRLQPPTSIVNLAPVDTQGRPTPGWSVVDHTGPGYSAGLDCSFNSASPAAPAGDIYYCSPSAATADACWVAADRVNVLCLADPSTRKLIKMTPDVMPTGPADHSERAHPIRIDLDNGDSCRLRNGGSWGARAADPGLVGWYACRKVAAVWSKPDVGIDKSGKTWTVTTGNESGPLTKHKVTTAYFLATAP